MPIESISKQQVPLASLPSPTEGIGHPSQSHFERLSEIVRTAGERSGGWRGIYDLYDEMLDKDGHLYSVVQTRIHGVMGRDRTVIPGGDSERDAAVAQWVRNALENLPEWVEAQRWLLGSLARGLGVVEIEWGYRSGGAGDQAGPPRPHGWVAPIGLRRRLPQEFVFDTEGNPMHLAGRDRHWWGQATAAQRATHVDPQRLLVMRFEDTPGNPYGVGLCQRAFWLHWFKKQTLKFWLIFNEKFGQPTVIGKYPNGTSESDQDALLEVVESIQTDAGVTIPEGMVLEMLEAQRTGSISTYRELVDWCNDEMSKIVLGETLTADEGRRSGSLALGRIHDLVRNEYIEADARLLMAVVNDQLIAPMIRFNFGMDVPCPRWVIDTAQDENLKQQIEIDRDLISIGVPLSLDHFYRKYHRAAPKADERTLRYDDHNLYQYHLEYGVLTTNEVRQVLGLEPVPWGDGPPQRQTPSAARGQSAEERDALNQAPEDPGEVQETLNEA